MLHGRLERRPTKSDILYIMTHFEDNISVLRSQGITLPYYGTVVQARASGARHWLALPVCHAKLAQQPDKAKIEHVHQALIMRLRQSPSVDCWIKAGHSSIARAFQIVPTNDTQSTVRYRTNKAGVHEYAPEGVHRIAALLTCSRANACSRCEM